MPGSVPASSAPLVPTFNGFVQNSMDGLMLFEACLSGNLHHVPRRPHDRERNALIKSGSIFVYEENASGIKRWTDGVAWSPSRILGNFLIYRELEKPFAPGEKKRAMKRKRSFQADGQVNGSRPASEGEDEITPTETQSPLSAQRTPSNGQLSAEASTPIGDNEREMERQLIGSLVDSYGFRPNGLVKKTMSVSVNGVAHHLVSYYSINDVKHRNLIRPMNDARLVNTKIRPELYLKQNFRTPVEETEHYIVDSTMHARPNSFGAAYPGMPSDNAQAPRPGQYIAAPHGYPMYGAPGPAQSAYSSMPPSNAPAWHAPPPLTHQSNVSDAYGRQHNVGGISDGYGRPPPPLLPSVADGYGRPLGIPESYTMASQYHHPSSAGGYPHHDMRHPSPPHHAQSPHAHSAGSYGAQHPIDHASTGPYSNYRMTYDNKNRPNV